MAKNAQNIRNAKSANIEMWPILIPHDDHWPQNMWKTKENTMECLRKNRAEWKSTKKHPKNYFLKTFPKNILFFGQNYPKICTKKDFKKNWLVTYTLGWICSGGSVSSNCEWDWTHLHFQLHPHGSTIDLKSKKKSQCTLHCYNYTAKFALDNCTALAQNRVATHLQQTCYLY